MADVGRKGNIDVTTKLKINRNWSVKKKVPIDVEREWHRRNRRRLRFSKATSNEITGQKASPERKGSRTIRDWIRTQLWKAIHRKQYIKTSLDVYSCVTIGSSKIEESCSN
jgi:hypothetical protein